MPKAAQIYWADAGVIHLDHPIVQQVAAGLGLTKAKIAALFIAASAIACRKAAHACCRPPTRP